MLRKTVLQESNLGERGIGAGGALREGVGEKEKREGEERVCVFSSLDSPPKGVECLIHQAQVLDWSMVQKAIRGGKRVQ